MNVRIAFSSKCQSPSLRGSGLKCKSFYSTKSKEASPSLRGSGLKYQFTKFDVSYTEVSLFTREWIEICLAGGAAPLGASPSLRGSGLKYL